MAKINSKLYGDQYQTLDDFMSDFQLMFDNACRYNEPDSQVYKVKFLFLPCLSFFINKFLKVTKIISIDSFTNVVIHH